tara:strand:+ start:3462 stop:4442 length:981 start_codon:yes stop_codon:yes gene_type:complete
MTLSTHLHPVDTQTVTGTIVFGGACSVDETIVIVDAAGTSRTFTAKGSTTAGSLQFINTDATAAATALKLCIDNAAGFGTNSITVADNGSGTLTLTLIVNGTYRFEDKASIVEGLTNVTITKFGSTAGLEDIDGGVVANAGTIPAAGSRFTAKSPLDLNAGSRSSGAKVVANTGTANEIGIAKANTSGTLAYNPSGRDVTRSSSDTGFVIRSGVANKISGVAGLNPILSGGSDTTSRRGGNIHPKTKYYQKGEWATRTFDILTGTLVKGTDAGTAAALASDHAATPTRAIPGEFVILQNFVSYVGTSTSGDGTGSENLMDYSAITG